MSATPFTDPHLVTGALYAAPGRLAQRTGVLHHARISGGNAADTITTLARNAVVDAPGTVLDIGCGRGTTTIALARQWPTARLVALDQSAALLAATRDRLRAHGHQAEVCRADFHHLPIPDASVGLAVAAFCLYHATHPEHPIAEIGRVLNDSGRAVLVTKSADSYRAVDDVLAAAGVDPHAADRPSLYGTFHSGNAEFAAATAGLVVRERVDERHVFRFTDLDHLAAYAATSPKYHLPTRLTRDPRTLATELRRHLPDQPVTATSTLTYLVVARA